MKKYYSNGKLLLTGEYVVLDGALSLALPTKFGQSLTVESIDEAKLVWKSLDNNGNVWFEDEFLIHQITTPPNPKNETSKRLLQILKTAKQLNLEFLSGQNGFSVTTELDFEKNWGLGTSSTLINNISNWAQVDAYKLLQLTFGGSGYDIACAQHDSVITYQVNDASQIVKQVLFKPKFKEHLYFVYLNKKQNSRDAIAHYKTNSNNLSDAILEINEITAQMIKTTSLVEFETLVDKHEIIISNLIDLKPVKETLFKDFKGSIKSLGASGGDFVLVTSTTNPTAYFKSKGFDTVIIYNDMVLN